MVEAGASRLDSEHGLKHSLKKKYGFAFQFLVSLCVCGLKVFLK